MRRFLWIIGALAVLPGCPLLFPTDGLERGSDGPSPGPGPDSGDGAAFLDAKSAPEGGASPAFDNAVVVASGQTGPRAIAVDSGYLYWLSPTTNTVGVLARGATSPALQMLPYPHDVVTDGASVFISTDNTHSGGQCGDVFTVASGFRSGGHGSGVCYGVLGRMVRVGATIYGISGYGEIVSVDTSSLGESTPLPQRNPGPTSLAVLAGVAYFILNGTLLAQSLSNTPAITVTPNRVIEVTADTSHVYWVTETGDMARISADASATAEPLASGLTAAVRLALDASNVYVTTSEGTVVAVPKAGGAKSTIATGQGSPFAIVADDLGVYWTTLEGNIVMLAKKKP